MPNEYILMTDDNCDLPYDYYEKNGIARLFMPYSIDDVIYRAGDRTIKEFYDLVRAGKMPTTMQANAEEIKEVMEPYLKAGKDVLYLAFGSGLSGTYNNAVTAVNELNEQYPGTRACVVDSLCASMGQGLFVHLANREKQKGATLDELVKWARDNRLHLAHYVMADDLMHLHRGGRVSKASAIAGGLMGIKPIIYMDNEGRLISIGKVRGKKQALTSLVDKLEAIGTYGSDYFMISHADCEEDANFVAELMVKRFGIKDYMINFIGPVVGSHTGCGTIALFMMAQHR